MDKIDKTNNKLQLRNVDANKRKSLKWYNTSKKSKMKRKYKNLDRIDITYNLKD